MSVRSSSKPPHPYFPVSLKACHIQEYLKNKRGRKQEFINPQKEKGRHEERMKQSKVIFQAKFFVEYWDLIPMESGAEFSSPRDTATVRFVEERPAAKK